MTHTKKTFSLFLLIFLTKFLLVSSVANAGWFGYDNYQECLREERKKRMDRWFNPMNRIDASVVAKDECDGYVFNKKARTKKQSKSTRKSEYTRLLNILTDGASEEKMKNFKGPCTKEAKNAGYCTPQQYKDYQVERSLELDKLWGGTLHSR